MKKDGDGDAEWRARGVWIGCDCVCACVPSCLSNVVWSVAWSGPMVCGCLGGGPRSLGYPVFFFIVIAFSLFSNYQLQRRHQRRKQAPCKGNWLAK